jgi:hypothetical protein
MLADDTHWPGATSVSQQLQTASINSSAWNARVHWQLSHSEFVGVEEPK